MNWSAGRYRRRTVGEFSALFGVVRDRVRRDGLPAVQLALSAGLVVVVFTVLRLSPVSGALVDRVSGLRTGAPWGQWWGRLPLSVFAPAPQLPMWGALAQVLIVIALAEVLVGWRRTAAVAALSHVLASLAGRLVAGSAVHAGALTGPSWSAVRDTGPSAAVVAVAVALAIGVDLPLVAVAVSAVLAVATIMHPGLAAVEHGVAIVVGVAVGVLWRHGDAVNLAPVVSSGTSRGRRIRRMAAAVFAVCGLVDLAAGLAPAVTGPVLRAGREVLPFAVSGIHREFAVVVGVVLLLVGRGLRRGQSAPWALAVAIAGCRLLAPPRHPADVVGLVTVSALLVGLLTHRRRFGAPGRTRAARTIPVAASVVPAVAGVAALVGRALAHRDGSEPYGRVVLAVVERLLDIDTIVLPTAINQRLGPWLGLTGAALVGSALWLQTRPARSPLPPDPTTRARARTIVTAWGTDTLAWFALRDDKCLFFTGETMVAYSVKGATAVVSPDPIGPPHERAEAWEAFRRFAHEHGWSSVVLAASGDWLPVYLADDMHAIYIGDEAIIDVASFTLDGGRKKGLRQAAARIARHGYTVSFHDPSELDADLVCQLEELATKSRRGHGERGYSMTLGRFFHRDDHGMLLVVCRDPTGHPVAFCTFVPAPAIGGWSLDAMRRDRAEHPNGILDYVIVETIAHARATGARALCLNFAMMRSIVAGHSETTAATKVLRWLLRKGSESMQIESLWRYNAKFDPSWSARYAVFETLTDVPDALVAVARVESVWELPVLGRLLRPSRPPHMPNPRLLIVTR